MSALFPMDSLVVFAAPARSAKNEREAWKYIKKQTLDRVAPWLRSVLLISHGAGLALPGLPSFGRRKGEQRKC